ncbi:hypothetical protein [Kribbella lupini]|uniref:PASTA domain-containing protein n=1 Tax=Kribbella lupini TaxID=291602 RepID=A0ABN2ADN7_9ACTN
MNTQLEPPKVPPLAPDSRARLRARVLDQASLIDHPQSRRRWVGPAVAVAAVGAVVAGSVAVAGRPDEVVPAPQVAASPTPSIDKSKIVKVQKDYTSKIGLAAMSIDLGPVPAAEAAALAKNCTLVRPATSTDVLWSRRVQAPPPSHLGAGVVLLVKSSPGQPGTVYRQGVTACLGSSSAAVRDTDWKRQPTRSYALVTLAGTGAAASADAGRPAFADYRSLYRARADVVRIKSRLVWRKGSGEWFEGVVKDGYAVTHSQGEVPKGTPATAGLDVEVKAYDARGRELPVK